MKNLPPLEDLRLFCDVVRMGGFAAAAGAWGASPAFVSKRIALLEGLLGARLLHRTTRRVGLTEDGAAVHRWSLRILEDAAQMADALSVGDSEPRGLVRIATSGGFGRRRVAPALSVLAARHPALRIQLEFLSRPVDLVTEGFDLDFRIGLQPEANLLARRILDNERVLCASPAYRARRGLPATLEDLPDHACIVVRERDQSFGTWRLEGPMGVQSVNVEGPLACSDGETAHAWALDGHGIILRSTWDVGEDLASGRLVRVLPEWRQDAPVLAVYPLRLTGSAKVRVCVDFVEAWLGGRAGA
ncbi:MAG TPA: LysR family transcriptional regulator [Holophaga sp.]|nr:LysR family transcriptional regulator [Holophaga sp.]